VTKIGVYIFPFVVVQLGFEDKMPWGPFRGLLSLLVQGTHFQRLPERKERRHETHFSRKPNLTKLNKYKKIAKGKRKKRDIPHQGDQRC